MTLASFLSKILDIMTNLDTHLSSVVAQYGLGAYAIIFAVLALETGDLISAFLPSDSLVFTAGAMAGVGILNIWILYIVCVAGVFVGDTVNYWIGRGAGYLIIQKNYKFLNKKHIEKAQGFFDKFGPFALVIGRYIPFVRTLTPFFSGIAKMPYWKFNMLEAIGASTWVALFLFGGYFFGGLPFVQENFIIILILLTLVSCIPIFVALHHYFRDKKIEKQKKKSEKNNSVVAETNAGNSENPKS